MDAKDTERVNETQPATGREARAFQLGLIGWPLGHSLSPRLHHAALRSAGLTGHYQKYAVSPENLEGLRALLNRLRRGSLEGLNVTIPHKRSVIPYLQELTDTARSVGAVNTIFRLDGRLVGDNTDVDGFLTDLAALTTVEPVPGRPALVLGAGGAARAVVFGLRRRGWEVCVAARRIEQARRLVKAIQPAHAAEPRSLRVVSLKPEALVALSDGCRLVVNATPVGMTPHRDASPWPFETPLPPEAAVYDLVYNPTDTALVQAARSAGLPARSGLGMLVEQAALAFERWTGRQADRRAMFAAVSDDE